MEGLPRSSRSGWLRGVLACGLLAIGLSGLWHRWGPRLLQHGMAWFGPSDHVLTFRVEGTYERVGQQALFQAFTSGALTYDGAPNVASLTQRLRALPWVAKVAAHRVWPDHWTFWVHEAVPFMRWNDGGISDANGRVFDVPEDAALASLVHGYGPPGSALRVVQMFKQFMPGLQQAHLQPVALALADDGWTLWLQNAVVVHLGQKTPCERLERFLKEGYPHLVAHGVRLQHRSLDLRYPAGFALSEVHRPHST